jgi:hypothetical protein
MKLETLSSFRLSSARHPRRQSAAVSSSLARRIQQIISVRSFDTPCRMSSISTEATDLHA